MARPVEDTDYSAASSQRGGHIAYVLEPSRPEEGAAPTSGFTGAFDIFTKIVAPTTLLTALAFYFGRQFTYARADYFGIDASVLGLSTQDYVVRSLDALFIPLGALVICALVALRCHAGIARRLESGSGLASLHAASRRLIIVSLPILLLGIVGAVRPLPIDVPYLLVPLSSGLGLALLSYGLYLRSQTDASKGRYQPAAWISVLTRILVVSFVVLSLFWTTSVYAQALGTGRAEALNMDERPQATVYSAKRLHIEGPSIREQALGDADSAYRFRYSGLRLLIESGGKFFLLPNGWSPDDGQVLVIADDKTVRLEFHPGGAS